MDPLHFKRGNIVDLISRSGSIHMPMGVRKKITEVGVFESRCVDVSEAEFKTEPQKVRNFDICSVSLSDELLLSCGFVREKYLRDLFVHSKAYRFKLLRLEDGTYQFEAHRPIVVKHLHRLQNLFFEVEDMALEVNL